MQQGDTRQQGWVERPWAARAVGLTAFVVPFLASIGAAFMLSSALPSAPSWASGVVRWLGIAIVSTAVLMLVERQTRRLLPLRTLLGLTLAFPDRAPSRFKLAIRTGTTNQLRVKLQEASDGRLGDTPSEAAERLLELVGMLSQHDRLTRGHSERVRAYSHLIGEEMGMTGDDLDRLRWAGLLHDVGKLAISPDILNKPGKLTAEEYDLVKEHPMEGKKLVEPLADWLGESARAVWEHHERFDGGGYPAGLSGLEISRAARIVSVADTFDVMTSVRSYKSALSPARAREELARCAGTQFDPEVVRAFLALSMGRVRIAVGPLSWLAQLSLFPQAVVAQAGPTLATTAAVTAGAAAGTVGIVAGPVAATVPDEPEQAQVAQYEGMMPFDLVEPSEEVVVIEGVAARDAGDGAAPATEPAVTTSSSTSTTTTTTEVASTTTSPPPETTTVPEVTLAPTETSIPSSTTTVADRPTTTDAPERVTTTTTPETTTTTTTTPETTTTTTTTTAPTTTSTTSTTTTTTTTTTTLPSGAPVAGARDLFLIPSGFGDTESQPVLALTNTPWTAGTLANYDTDRDSAPGLLIQKDAAGANGTDPTKVQVFSGTAQQPTAFVSDVRLELWVAAKDYSRSNIDVEVVFNHCDAADNCTLLDSDSRRVSNANRFKRLNIELEPIDVVVAAGERLELRIAVLDGSEDDAWLAFGATGFDSQIHFH